MRKITVVGLDPSMNNFGIVVANYDLDSKEVSILGLYLSQPIKDKDIKNQRVNSKDLNTAKTHAIILASVIPDDAVVFAEVPVGSQSARAMASYGMCIGLLAGVKQPVISVTPTEVKVAATNNKNATKADMIRWATTKHPRANWRTVKRNGEIVFTDANEHLADALAAIYAGLQTPEFRTACAVIK